MDRTDPPQPLVRWTSALEQATVLDRAVQAVKPTVTAAFGTGRRGSVLRGDWLGHAVHPVLTDLVVGTWTSASVLDLLGGRGSSEAAQKLIGTGLLAAGPTAWTGWAEWSVTGQREQRVGVVHAATNAVAIGVYAASWVARQRGRHQTGARLALIGTAVTGLGAYLGGHLAVARDVGSHHPFYDDTARPAPGATSV